MTLSIIVCGDMTSTETDWNHGKLGFVYTFFYHLLKQRILWSIKQSHNLIMRILILNQLNPKQWLSLTSIIGWDSTDCGNANLSLSA